VNAKVARSTVRDFYRRLHNAAGQRPPERQNPLGAVLRLGHQEVAVRVTAYAGSFNRPKSEGEPMPRVWVSLDGPDGFAAPALELTCTLVELPRWAAWVFAWIKARLGYAAGIPAPPTRLEFSEAASALVEASYLWTEQATRAYEFRRRAVAEAQARRRFAVAGR